MANESNDERRDQRPAAPARRARRAAATSAGEPLACGVAPRRPRRRPSPVVRPRLCPRSSALTASRSACRVHREHDDHRLDHLRPASRGRSCLMSVAVSSCISSAPATVPSDADPAAGQRGAADHDRGDRGQLHQVPERRRVAGLQPRGGEDAGDRGEHARSDVRRAISTRRTGSPASCARRPVAADRDAAAGRTSCAAPRTPTSDGEHGGDHDDDTGCRADRREPRRAGRGCGCP